MDRSYEYTGINNSTIISVLAGADIGQAGATAVAFSESAAVPPQAGLEPIGIVLITQDEPVKKGDDISIQVKDIGLWKAGAEIEAGDLLATDAEGLCQKATTGQYVYARALSTATAKGDMVTVQIINAGYAV